MSPLLDLRWAWRGLARRRGVAAAALLTLGVGLGINTAVFSLVDAVLLRSRPLRDPARLAVLWTVWKLEGQTRNKLSEPEYLDFAGQARLLSGVEVYTISSANLTGEGEPEQVTVGTSTAGLLPLLGVPPLLGRTFRREEELPASRAVVVLSEELWRRRFGAEPSIVGRNIRLDGESAEVIGVVASWFELPGKVDLWQPLSLDRAKPTPRGAHFLTGIARLAPRVQWSQAQAEVAAIAGGLRQRYPEFYPPSLGWGARLAPLLAEQSADLRPALLLLAAAAALVLLVACVNVANLRLASLRHQVKELAVRVAFGASRWQVARQLLAESLLVALAGGGLGLLLGGWAVRLLPSLLPVAAPRLAEASLDLPVLAFTLAATLLAAAVAGLVPALQVARIGPHAALKDAGARTTQGAASRRLQRWLVGGETAMALLLLIAAGLVLENLVRLEHVPLGFDPHRVLTASVALPNTKYPTPAALDGFYQQVLPRLGGLPGVEAAGAVSLLPLGGKDYSGDFSVEGMAAGDAQASHEASRRAISQDYFRAMRIPLLAGRIFTVHDAVKAPGAVIVDGDLARRYWPQSGAVGRRLKLGKPGESSPWLTVVGVVGHVKHDGLDSQSRGQMYFPVAQFPRPEMTLVLRTRKADPLSVAPGVVREVRAVDGAQPVSNLRTMEDWLARSLFKQRLLTALLLLAAGLASALAMVGLYAALASSTSERLREIGIRMAMGANRGDILRLMLAQGATLAGRGIAVGVLIALAAAPALASQLTGLSPYDPVAYLGAALALAAVALLASLLPARRATRVEPVETLRVE